MIPAEAIDVAAKEIYHTSGRSRVMPYSEARSSCRAEALLILEAAVPYLSDAARQPRRTSPTDWPDVPRRQ